MTNFKIKFKSIKNLIRLFLQNVSIHGLGNFERTRRLTLKILWFGIVLISALYCFSSIIKSFNEYFEYHKVVMSYTHYDIPGSVPLPAITFCSNHKDLTIDDMLLYGFYYDVEITSSHFYKLYNHYIDDYQNCYTFNNGKNSYGNRTEILQGGFGQVYFDFFIGDSDSTNNSDMGLLLIIHGQKSYVNQISGVTISGGEQFLMYLSLRWCMIIF